MTSSVPSTRPRVPFPDCPTRPISGSQTVSEEDDGDARFEFFESTILSKAKPTRAQWTSLLTWLQHARTPEATEHLSSLSIWETLQSFDIVPATLAEVLYTIQCLPSTTHSDSRQAALVYLTLASIPGASAFTVFQPHIFQSILVTLKRSMDVLEPILVNPAKGGMLSSKSSSHPSESDNDSSDSDNDSSDSDSEDDSDSESEDEDNEDPEDQQKDGTSTNAAAATPAPAKPPQTPAQTPGGSVLSLTAPLSPPAAASIMTSISPALLQAVSSLLPHLLSHNEGSVRLAIDILAPVLTYSPAKLAASTSGASVLAPALIAIIDILALLLAPPTTMKIPEESLIMTANHLFKALLPLLSVRGTSGASRVFTSTLRTQQTTALEVVAWIKDVLTSKNTASPSTHLHRSIVALTHHIATDVGERAEIRAVTSKIIFAILQILPGIDGFVFFAPFLLKFSRTKKTAYRLFSTDLAASIIPIAYSNQDIAPDSETISEPCELVLRACVEVLLARSSDQAGSVRSKALSHLGAALTSKGSKAASKSLTIPQHVAALTVAINIMSGAPVDANTSILNTSALPTDMSLVSRGIPQESLTGLDAIWSLFQRRLTDEQSAVRRSSVNTLAAVATAHASPTADAIWDTHPGILSSLSARTADTHMMIRAATVNAVTSLLSTAITRLHKTWIKSGEDEFEAVTSPIPEASEAAFASFEVIARTWIDSVLPLVMDAETMVVEAVLDSVSKAIFKPIAAVFRADSSGPSTGYLGAALYLLGWLEPTQESCLARIIHTLHGPDPKPAARFALADYVASLQDLLMQTRSHKSIAVLGAWRLLDSLSAHRDAADSAALAKAEAARNEPWLGGRRKARGVQRAPLVTPSWMSRMWSSLIAPALRARALSGSNGSNPIRDQCVQRWLHIASCSARALVADVPAAATAMASALTQVVSSRSLPLVLVSPALEALTSITAEQNGRGRAGTPPWAAELMMDAESSLASTLNKYVEHATGGSLESSSTEHTDVAGLVFLVGELGLLMPPHRISTRLVTSLQALTAPSGDGVHSHLASNPTGMILGGSLAALEVIRAHAYAALGKICVRNESLAKQCMPVFARELSPDTCTGGPAIRNNVVVVISDLARTWTSVVDLYIPRLALCLRDPNEIVRRHTATLLTRLVSEDFVKAKGSLPFKMLALLVDDSSELRSLGWAAVTQLLLRKWPLLVFNSFVEAVFFFNGHTGHPSYNSFSSAPMTPTERGLFTFAGTDDAAVRKRSAIYRCMALTCSPEQKMSVAGKLVTDVLGGIVDGVIKLEESEDVIRDALRILASPEMEPETKASLGARDDDPDTEAPMDEGVEAAALAVSSAKAKIVKAVNRRTTLEVEVPTLIAVKNMAQRANSPVLGPIMGYLAVLKLRHGAELDAVLEEDPATAKELEFDLEQWEAAQQNLEKSSILEETFTDGSGVVPAAADESAASSEATAMDMSGEMGEDDDSKPSEPSDDNKNKNKDEDESSQTSSAVSHTPKASSKQPALTGVFQQVLNSRATPSEAIRRRSGLLKQATFSVPKRRPLGTGRDSIRSMVSAISGRSRFSANGMEMEWEQDSPSTADKSSARVVDGLMAEDQDSDDSDCEADQGNYGLKSGMTPLSDGRVGARRKRSSEEDIVSKMIKEEKTKAEAPFVTDPTPKRQRRVSHTPGQLAVLSHTTPRVTPSWEGFSSSVETPGSGLGSPLSPMSISPAEQPVQIKGVRVKTEEEAPRPTPAVTISFGPPGSKITEETLLWGESQATVGSGKPGTIAKKKKKVLVKRRRGLLG